MYVVGNALVTYDMFYIATKDHAIMHRLTSTHIIFTLQCTKSN